MKKIILTAVIALVLLYVGLIDFSYAEDYAKSISELTATEIAAENVPMILAQEKSTTGNYQFSETYDTKKVEDEEKEEEIEEDDDDDVDDPDAGVKQKKRNKTRTEKVKQGKN